MKYENLNKLSLYKESSVISVSIQWDSCTYIYHCSSSFKHQSLSWIHFGWKIIPNSTGSLNGTYWLQITTLSF